MFDFRVGAGGYGRIMPFPIQSLLRMNVLLSTLLLSLFSSGSVMAANVLEDYEQPIFLGGEQLESYAGWTVYHGDGTILAEAALAGAQGVVLAPSVPSVNASKALTVNSGNIAFTDLLIQPAVVSEGSLSSAYTLDIDGALIGFVNDAGTGKVFALNGDGQGTGNDWLDALIPFGLDALGKVAEAPLRITVRADYASGRWDLFVNGELLMADLQFFDTPAGAPSYVMDIFGDSDDSVFFDNLEAGDVNPLFLDADRDAMSDVWESGHGLSTTANDRDGDLDGDSMSNLEEFINGKLPNVHDYDAEQTYRYFYVDNDVAADDSRDGLSAVNLGSVHGPKATLSAAISIASDGDTVIFQPGSVSYDEAMLSAPAKTVILKPNGIVTIR